MVDGIACLLPIVLLLRVEEVNAQCPTGVRCVFGDCYSGVCYCNEGFVGHDCASDLDECVERFDLCNLTNSARCRNFIGTYICSCKFGYKGQSCNDEIDLCMMGYCYNARCTKTGPGTAECSCTKGFAGSQCKKLVTPDTPTPREAITGFFSVGPNDAAATSDFPSAIIGSVGVSVIVIALVVGFAAAFVRRDRRRRSAAAAAATTLTTQMQLSNYHPPRLALPSFHPASEPPDKWEFKSDDLTLLDVIGEGFFGVVLRAEVRHRPKMPLMMQKRLNASLKRDSTVRRRSSGSRQIKTMVACKMLKETGTFENQTELLEEIKLMKRIGQHEHIVSMIACITRSHPVCLIVEYCTHGDLSSYLKKGRGHWFSGKQKQLIACDDEGYVPMHRPSHSYADIPGKVNEDERHVKFTSLDLLSFVWQIASGMEYLSGKGLVHRDLACRNVLVVDEKLLKVSDFGLTRAVQQDGIYPQKTTRRLPLRWMSVEAIADRLFTEQSDVWSFGVVMWEICTLGSFPYSSVSTRDLLSHLRAGGRLERPDNCSEELYDMMSKCWCAEPESRPAFSVLAENLGKLLEEEQPTRYLQLDFSSSCKMWDLELAGTELGGEIDADAGEDAIVSGAATIMMQEVPGPNADADDS